MVEFRIKGHFPPPTEKPAADPLQEAYAQLQEAERLRQRGQFERAQAICESLLQRHPDYAGALHTLGLILADQEKHEEALDCLVRALMMNPQNWATLTALSGVYLRLGATEMAAHTLERAKSIKPQDANVLLMLGDIYREQREYELAHDAYLQATKLEPSLVPAVIGLGWTHEDLGDPAAAADVFEGLIKRGMRLIEPLRALAALPASAVSVDLLAHLDKVLRDPSENELQFENSLVFVRAVALDRAGRHADAWQHLVQANRTVFLAVQDHLNGLVEWRRAGLAALSAHPGQAGRGDSAAQPVSLFILGPSRSGKTTMEKLVSTLPGVKRGYENPIIENIVRRTFQTSGLPIGGSLARIPPQLYPLCRETYLEELARRVGSAKVFTNTLSTRINDAAQVAAIFPNVRFILVKRNVEDNLLRVYMRKYTKGNAYAYDLKAARDHIVWYHQMMDLMAKKFPGIVRVVAYEDMVADPVAALSVAADLCGASPPNAPQPVIVSDAGCAAPYRKNIAIALAD